MDTVSILPCGVSDLNLKRCQQSGEVLLVVVNVGRNPQGAIAFGDHVTAQDARRQQKLLLSSIGDCNECHGRLMENGEKCVQCGNPFWKYAWLTAD